MRIPKRTQVEVSIRRVKRRLQSTLKAVNQQAGKLLQRGKYTEAEELVVVGRSIDAFQSKADDLLAEWRTLTGRAKGGSRADKTPLWRLYHPILKALVSVGGSADAAELERALPPFLEGQATQADMTPGPRGVARWKALVRRARRPMIKEGLLEAARGKRWQLSSAGRRAADQATPPESASANRS